MMKTIGKRKKSICLIVGIILCILSIPANAALITIAIEATIDVVSDPANHLEGNISAGDIITGYYTYESTTADSDPFSDGGEYLHHSTPCGMFLTIGGFEFKTDLSNVEFAIGILNNSSNKDSYNVTSLNNVPLSNGITVDNIFWYLKDSTMTALYSDALPTTAPILSDWEDNRLNVHGGPRSAEFGFDVTVTSATVVPEPVTILLFALGGVILRKTHTNITPKNRISGRI